jgi:hypothetical protein
MTTAAPRLARLARAGCAVLHIATSDHPLPLPAATHTLHLPTSPNGAPLDPTAVIDPITRTITRALTHH